MPTIQDNLHALLDAGLTIDQVAAAIGATQAGARTLIANPNPTLTATDRHRLETLTLDCATTAAHLVRATTAADALDHLIAQGCQPTQVATTLALTTHDLENLRTTTGWIPTTTGPGQVTTLTIDDVVAPTLPAQLTWGRIHSLATMGWSAHDITTTINHDLPDSPHQLIPRPLAQAVAAYWQAYGARLNRTGIDLARHTRAQGVRTPADWEPPQVALWWPPKHLRHHLGQGLDWSCGPTPLTHPQDA